jgi:alpha-L-arabinofuranosidase
VNEERLLAYEGLIRALCLQENVRPMIPIAVDEWNVWYRTHPQYTTDINGLEEIYNLEDAENLLPYLNALAQRAGAFSSQFHLTVV